MLRKLWQQTTGSMNPSYLNSTLPGGAGSISTGTTPNPGISAPFIEPFEIEAFDVTAPSLIGTANPGKTLGTPAPAGKLLVVDPANSGPGGWLWKLNAAKLQPIPHGQYGIVVKPALTTVGGNFQNGSIAVGTTGGNISQPGDKALVVIDGPVQAFVQTTVNTTAISAGMPLAADGAGNLTYAGASPSVGTVLATAMDSMSGSISIPVMKNVYLGGY